MSAGLLNLVIDQGADWYLQITWNDSNGDPIDITGFTAEMQMRSLPNATTAQMTLSTSNGGITLDGPNGIIELHATATQTGNIDEGPYYYDLEITSPAPQNIVTRVSQGQAIVSAQVTR